jgi:hypothetical protein
LHKWNSFFDSYIDHAEIDMHLSEIGDGGFGCSFTIREGGFDRCIEGCHIGQFDCFLIDPYDSIYIFIARCGWGRWIFFEDFYDQHFVCLKTICSVFYPLIDVLFSDISLFDTIKPANHRLYGIVRESLSCEFCDEEFPLESIIFGILHSFSSLKELECFFPIRETIFYTPSFLLDTIHDRRHRLIEAHPTLTAHGLARIIGSDNLPIEIEVLVRKSIVSYDSRWRISECGFFIDEFERGIEFDSIFEN